MPKYQEDGTKRPQTTVKTLDILVGEWGVQATHPGFASCLIGRSSFERLDGEDLYIWRSDFEHSGPPSAISVIGHDDSVQTYSILYADDRGVSRIYGMSLDASQWKMWRDCPGFSQRFTGVFKKSGTVISGYWEKSADGTTWERDLELIFTKMWQPLE